MNARALMLGVCGGLLCAGSALAQNCNPTTIPLAPGGLTATDGDTCGFTLVQWLPVSPLSGVTYRVWRAENGDLDSTEMVADQLLEPVYIDQQVVPGTNYLYWSQAVAANNCVSELSPADIGFAAEGSPELVDQPADTHVLEGESVELAIDALGGKSVQWYKDGVPLIDDARISGSGTASMVIHWALEEDAGSYEAIVTNGCGIVTTNEALLIVGDSMPCLRCPVDFDRDGGVSLNDFFEYFVAWGDGSSCADVNRDGGIDGSDVEHFAQAWEAGGC